MLASCADRYALMHDRIADPGAFAELRQQALGVSLMGAQAHCSALELIPEFRAALPRELAPPLMAILLLGAISSSCTVIAACSTPQGLDGVTLLSAKRLQAILSSKEVAGWLSTTLS